MDMDHGLVEAKEKINDIPKGTKGIITAYLPKIDRFAVIFEKVDGCEAQEKWITFNKKEFEEYCTVLELELELDEGLEEGP